MTSASPAPPELDNAPPPLPGPRPSLGLFFQTGETEEETPTLSSTSVLGMAGDPIPADRLGDGSPSASASDDPAHEWSDEAPTSSPSPSDPASRKPLSPKALKPMLRQGVLIGSGVAHRFGARTEGQQLAGLYLADEEDAAAIADPLASIAARHEGVAGKVSPDTADAITAMMGVAGFLSKQMVKAQLAAAHDAAAAARQPVQPVYAHEDGQS